MNRASFILFIIICYHYMKMSKHVHIVVIYTFILTVHLLVIIKIIYQYVGTALLNNP